MASDEGLASAVWHFLAEARIWVVEADPHSLALMAVCGGALLWREAHPVLRALALLLYTAAAKRALAPPAPPAAARVLAARRTMSVGGHEEDDEDDEDDDEAHQPRCFVLAETHAKRLRPDGTCAAFQTARFSGACRFKTTLDGGNAGCAVALRGRFDKPLAPGTRLFFGADIVDGEVPLGRGARSCAAALLTLAKKLMKCDVRYDLVRQADDAGPFVHFDAFQAADVLQIDDAADEYDTLPLDVPRAQKDEGAVELLYKSNARITMCWRSKNLDLQKWAFAGLPRWLGGEMGIGRLWGDGMTKLRFVLYALEPAVGDQPQNKLVIFEMNVERSAVASALKVRRRRSSTTDAPAPASSADEDADGSGDGGEPALGTDAQQAAAEGPAVLVDAAGIALFFVKAAGAPRRLVALEAARSSRHEAASPRGPAAADVVRQLTRAERRRRALRPWCDAGGEDAAVDAAARRNMANHSTTLSELFCGGAAAPVAGEDARVDVACLLRVWKQGWLVGRLVLDLDRGECFFAAKRSTKLGGLTSQASLRLPLSTVDGARALDALHLGALEAAPRDGADSLGAFELLTPSRAWVLIVSTKRCADDVVEAIRHELDGANDSPADPGPAAADVAGRFVDSWRQGERLGAARGEFRGRVVLNRVVANRTESAVVPPDDVARAPARVLRLLAAATTSAAALQDALAAAAALATLTLQQVATLRGPAAIAFALNLYHCIVVHAQLAQYMRNTAAARDGKATTRSAMALSDLLSRASYIVAGTAVSLVELEHGIIRKNSSAPSTMLRSLLLPSSAVRAALPLRVAVFDARLNFAMHAGIAASGPARVCVFDAESLDGQLRATAARCVSHFLAHAAGPLLPPVTRFFVDDFTPGSSDRRGLAAALSAYLPEGEPLDRLCQLKQPLNYAEFDCTVVPLDVEGATA
ncbi:hypothetical protein M885DRAFT_546073 [Pelagophyceae sp. CCMP2097]|nr:hypothetical protein M885DRAFT_546073 [Pelagophyceae sp. CCMP2097]